MSPERRKRTEWWIDANGVHRPPDCHEIADIDVQLDERPPSVIPTHTVNDAT